MPVPLPVGGCNQVRRVGDVVLKFAADNSATLTFTYQLGYWDSSVFHPYGGIVSYSKSFTPKQVQAITAVILADLQSATGLNTTLGDTIVLN